MRRFVKSGHFKRWAIRAALYWFVAQGLGVWLLGSWLVYALVTSAWVGFLVGSMVCYMDGWRDGAGAASKWHPDRLAQEQARVLHEATRLN